MVKPIYIPQYELNEPTSCPILKSFDVYLPFTKMRRDLMSESQSMMKTSLAFSNSSQSLLGFASNPRSQEWFGFDQTETYDSMKGGQCFTDDELCALCCGGWDLPTR